MTGRHSKNVEFMKTLKGLFPDLTKQQFAKACGKNPANMYNYLNGKWIPKKRVLVSSVEHLFGWNVSEMLEVAALPENLNELPIGPGIYVLYDSGVNVIYIGKATDLRSEIRQTLRRSTPFKIRIGHNGYLKKRSLKIRDLTHYISVYEVPSEDLRHKLEALLLRIFSNQLHNRNIGHFR